MSADLWIPGVVRQPLAINHAKDKYIAPVGDVFHVAVSEASSLLQSYKNRKDGIESTGYILRNGTIQQYRPLNVECDAQLAGNSWLSGGKWYGLNSWETQGMGEGKWTDAQIASIKKIIAWKHKNYGTPLRVNPSPTSSGFGYHRLFHDWNPNSHSCPGPDRVKQFNDIIVPWMKQGGDEDEMSFELKDIRNAPITLLTGKDNKPKEVTLQDALKDTDQTLELLNRKINAILKGMNIKIPS